MSKKPSFFEWISKVLKISEKIEREVSKIRVEIENNNSNNEEINLLIKKEIKKVREELKKQVTKEITEEVVENLLKENSESLKRDLVLKDDLDRVIKKHLEEYSTKVKTNIENSLDDKIGNFLKKNSDSLIRSGDIMSGEIKCIQKELKKTINLSNQEVINNISSIIKDQVNSLKNTLLEQDSLKEELEKSLKNQEERYKIQEKEYSKTLEKKEIEVNDYSNKLSKYEGGVSDIKDLLLSLDSRSLSQVKDNFYTTYQLVDGDDINNYIKVALEDKASIINDTLMYLRDIKIQDEAEVDSSEIIFYRAINKFYGNKIVLIEKLDDKEVVREFWDVDGNGDTLQKKIFPPLDLGDDILRGVAECGY